MAEERVKGGPPTKAVIAQRLNAVYELVSAGYRWAKVKAKVAEQAEKEAAARKKKEKPPLVWGDSGRVAERTLARYYKRANIKLIEEGKRSVKLGDLLLGRSLSRQDAVFAKAFEKERYEVCRKIIVDQLTLFGIMGKLNIQLSAFDTQAEEELPPDIGQSERTLPELIEAQWAILNAARARDGRSPLPSPAKLQVVAGGKI